MGFLAAAMVVLAELVMIAGVAISIKAIRFSRQTGSATLRGTTVQRNHSPKMFKAYVYAQYFSLLIFIVISIFIPAFAIFMLARFYF
jgi:hypothetical protein